MGRFDQISDVLTEIPELDQIIPRCTVVHIPAGDTPKNVVVQLPGPDGERVHAWWSGSPDLAEDDTVKLHRRGDDGLYDVLAVDAATPDATLSARLAEGIGDLLAGSGAGSFGRLPVSGNNGYVLTEDDGEALGLKWAPGGGGGGVWPAPGEVKIGNTVYVSIAAAVAAASAGDTIRLGEGTFTYPSGLFIPLGVSLVGSGYGTVINIVAGTDGFGIKTNGNHFFQNFKIEVDSGSGLMAMTLAGSYVSNIYVEGQVSASFGTITISTGQTFLNNITVSGGRAALYISTGASGGIINSFLNGSTYDLEFADDATNFQVENTYLANGVVETGSASTPLGSYIYNNERHWLGGGGGGVWPGPGEAKIGSTLYADLEAAIAAAGDGDLIKLGEGVHTLSNYQAIAMNLTIVGLGRTTTKITRSNNGTGEPNFYLAGAYNVRFYGVEIETTSTNRCNAVSVNVSSGSATIEFFGCALTVTQGAASSAGLYADSLAGGAIRLYDTLINSNQYGIYNENGTLAALELYGGRVAGATADVNLVQAVTNWRTYGTVFANGSLTIASASTVRKTFRVSDAGDLFPAGDGAGLFARKNALFPYTSHLNAGEIPSLTWLTGGGFLTPTITTSVPSFMWLNYSGGSAGNTKFFGYLGSFYNSIHTRCSVGIANGRAGLRMDDGSSSNYLELFLSNDSGMMKVQYRWSGGGGAVTDWLGGARIFPKFLILRLGRSGNTVYMFAHDDTYYGSLLGAVTFAGGWTPTRCGLFGEHPNGGTTDIQYAPIFDSIWYA